MIMATKEEVVKIIGEHFRGKDVGVGVLDCISEKEQVENLAESIVKLFSIPVVMPRLKCIWNDHASESLTIGKEYECVSDEGDYYCVIDDADIEWDYIKTRFEIINEA